MTNEANRPKPTTRQKIGGGLILGLILVAVIWGASSLIGGNDQEATTATAPVETAEPGQGAPSPEYAALDEFRQLAINDPTAALAQCTPADQTVSDVVASFLADDTHRLSPMFEVTEGDFTYYSANIEDGAGERVSSSDVWVERGGEGLAALSGSANEYTEMADGRDLYSMSAGDPPAVLAQTCVLAQQRQANTGD